MLVPSLHYLVMQMDEQQFTWKYLGGDKQYCGTTFTCPPRTALLDDICIEKIQSHVFYLRMIEKGNLYGFYYMLKKTVSRSKSPMFGRRVMFALLTTTSRFTVWKPEVPRKSKIAPLIPNLPFLATLLILRKMIQIVVRSFSLIPLLLPSKSFPINKDSDQGRILSHTLSPKGKEQTGLPDVPDQIRSMHKKEETIKWILWQKHKLRSYE